jgi:hypothetical protein
LGRTQPPVNHKRVERVERKHGILQLRKKVRTTLPEPSNQKVPDLLERPKRYFSFRQYHRSP